MTTVGRRAVCLDGDAPAPQINIALTAEISRNTVSDAIEIRLHVGRTVARLCSLTGRSPRTRDDAKRVVLEFLRNLGVTAPVAWEISIE